MTCGEKFLIQLCALAAKESWDFSYCFVQVVINSWHAEFTSSGFCGVKGLLPRVCLIMAFELINSLDDSFGWPRCCMFKDSSFHRLFSVIGDSKAEAGDFPFYACLWLCCCSLSSFLPLCFWWHAVCFCIILSREEHSQALWVLTPCVLTGAAVLVNWVGSGCCWLQHAGNKKSY